MHMCNSQLLSWSASNIVAAAGMPTCIAECILSAVMPASSVLSSSSCGAAAIVVVWCSCMLLLAGKQRCWGTSAVLPVATIGIYTYMCPLSPVNIACAAYAIHSAQ